MSAGTKHWHNGQPVPGVDQSGIGASKYWHDGQPLPVIVATAATGVTGTLAATETGSDTFAASGGVVVSGSLAVTETGSDAFAASGTVTVSGSLAATETGSDTFAATGTVADPAVTGTLDATETGADTFAASGAVVVAGTLAAAETGSDTFAASGAVVVSGSLAATETGTDTLAASGEVAVSGSMAATETGSDTFAGQGGGIYTVRPISDVSDGTWTDQDGGTNLYAAIDETSASDTDYIKSADIEAGDSDVCEVLLGAMSAPSVDTDHVIRYRYRAQGDLTINLTVALRQGTGTQIASATHNGVGASYVDGVLTLSEAEAANITNYHDLRLRFTAAA